MNQQTPENEAASGQDATTEATEQEQTTERSASQQDDKQSDSEELQTESAASEDDALAAAQVATAQAKDDLLRVQAEMQNLRRRTEQDVEKAHKFGMERFALELLTVVDNLERALDAAGDHDDDTVKAIREGVELTLKSFQDCFKKFGIEVVDPLSEPFDPQLHQAMSTQENPDVEPNTVTAVMQKGYTLHGRVLRPAMVMVSKAGS